MANPKASEKLTLETAWWGFLEDEELVASLEASAKHFGAGGAVDPDDLLQETFLWLSCHRDWYEAGYNMAKRGSQKMRDLIRTARAQQERVESWREWNDQWD